MRIKLPTISCSPHMHLVWQSTASQHTLSRRRLSSPGHSSIGHQQLQRPQQRDMFLVAAQTPPQPGLLTGLFQAIQAGLEQQAKSSGVQSSSLSVNGICYHPPGAESPLLQDINMQLLSTQLGLIYGRSGSGKSTLLQILAGLVQPSSGSIAIAQGNQQASVLASPSQLASQIGLVFQFPERHFLGQTIYDELTFAWPSDPWRRQAASAELSAVLRAVDLDTVSIKTPLRQLSDGYKRRVALAVQLARRPSVLLLDEPLAGLDWRARSDVARVLGKVKKQLTVLVVSHDLRELIPLVDAAWKMEMGGRLTPAIWPPA